MLLFFVCVLLFCIRGSRLCIIGARVLKNKTDGDWEMGFFQGFCISNKDRWLALPSGQHTHTQRERERERESGP